jgi:prepilin-type N-terminal cleavage/methylation domain-containing protein
MFRQSQRGFTLIELLIVVAIIAILAAIAVPNFLEAQTRAKVSRVRSDLRTIVTGIESYRVDNNRLPGFEVIDGSAAWQFGSGSRWFFAQLTTPIGYLSGKGVFQDPFIADRGGNLEYWRWYEVVPPTFTSAAYKAKIKLFGLSSWGPDRASNKVLTNYTGDTRLIEIYDATNGTISNGDIWCIDGNNAPGGEYEM